MAQKIERSRVHERKFFGKNHIINVTMIGKSLTDTTHPYTK